MLAVRRSVEKSGKYLVINGQDFDVIGFAVDRNNLDGIKEFCTNLKPARRWLAAVEAFEHGRGRFLVMFADAEAYDAGEPRVMMAEDEAAFELSVHRAISSTSGGKFCWNTCLDRENVDRLKLALYAETHLSGNC